MPLNYVLALALITAPQPPDYEVGKTPGLMQTVKEVAVNMQILDEKENNYMLVKVKDFDADIRSLQSRYKEYGKMPPVEDRLRFPNLDICNANCDFNRSYLNQIETRFNLGLDKDLGRFLALKEDIEKRFQIWDALRSAQIDYYVFMKREKLNKLKELIGEECYYNADLPAAVPLKYFTEIK